ncbi:MAG: PAS domain-containing protein [Chloroflexi bacterium]|nr:PAS domain-containing protein [Chloroflexota bacterium]
MKNRLSILFNRLTDVPTDFPDNARRQKILNILIVSIFFLTALAIILILALQNLVSLGLQGNEFYLAFVVLIGLAIVYFINRSKHLPSWLASFLFLVFLSAAFAYTDTPEQLANGRSLFVFTIPVIMSSMLLVPAASFLFAGLVTVELIIISNVSSVVPNGFAIGGFFLVAVVTWLSARSLEQAIKDLRVVNAELDQRVVERTSELATALSRETVEAGRREAILNSIADGVIVFDRTGTAILSNPSITNLVNKSQTEIIGKGLSDLLDSEDVKASDRVSLAALLEKSAQNLSNLRVKWGRKTLSVNAAEVRDGASQAIGTVAVFRDFTREAELEQMKNTFIAIVSHELRTPLNAILGYAEMLKEAVYGQINEKQKSVSGRIMTNTQRLLGIVSDLLDQAQIEAGKLKIQMIPCKPAELLDNIHGVMEKTASDKNLSLILKLDPAMDTTIIGDPQRLQQIMVNLTNNAVKFTDSGSVQVKVAPVGTKNWQIQTIDTGNGIPQDALEYIFETFRQVDGMSTRQHGGVGLGLSIVKQLVELMNGKITVESEIGKGSTFTVTLPLITHNGSPTVPSTKQE